MAASITVNLQIFKRPQLLRFSTDLDETGIKIYGFFKVVRDPCQKITLLLLKSKSVRVIIPEFCF